MSIRHLRSLLIPALLIGLTTIVSAQPASDAQPPIINYDN